MYQLCAPTACTNCVYHLHIPTACTNCVYQLRVPTACTNCMYQLLAPTACTNCVYQLHVPTACTNCLYRLHAPTACTNCLYQLHAPTACTNCVYQFCVYQLPAPTARLAPLVCYSSRFEISLGCTGNYPLIIDRGNPSYLSHMFPSSWYKVGTRYFGCILLCGVEALPSHSPKYGQYHSQVSG